MKQQDQEARLAAYLKKCEIEWRAFHAENGTSIDWLAPECDDLEHLAEYLKSLGFRIREVVDEVDSTGRPFQWVETRSGVIVFKNDELVQGFVARAAKR